MSYLKLQPHSHHIHLCMIIFATCFFLLIVSSFFTRSITIHQFLPTPFDASSNIRENRNTGVQEINKSSPPANNGTERATRLILIWSPIFEGWNVLKVGLESFSGCQETRCEITSNPSRVLESDALLFHARSISMLDIPRTRRPEQKWVFFNMEAPPYTRFHGMAFMSDMFNWTMTYRDDSDVVIHYGKATRSAKAAWSEELLYSSWKKKHKMVVWMVSHCSTHGRRESFVEEIEKYLDVAKFGACGTPVCPRQQTDECLENFSNSFYFYLSFENSICRGYITEKFFNSLKHNMIPVVFGGGNYSSIAPPESYIDAFDFPSAKDLARHLHQVASNFTLYAKYFSWKLEGYDINNVESPCDLCEKLHSDLFSEYSVYSDMDDWWIKQSHCRVWGVTD